ncbi:pyridoxal-dependent decarboxylase [Halobacillus salinarum]|uniref:Pyridoxal-dependent decarboxylase n=1 Tax=Halobacillus salinarum TaxID=2932257 RepID=A0ABY4EGG7_9BACI|nr:pyridoxal-dependent decarboxylase [Halobacillus salinarum]UOQ43569.1 pyridoxal-dependent decarboxylase [Halobacillus salinarum]
MELKKIQALFPSEDGNKHDRDVFVGMISQLLEELDSKKNAEQSILGKSKDRSGDYYQQIVKTADIPQRGKSFEEVLSELSNLMEGHPYHTKNFLTNVLPMASIPGLIGQFTASLLNGNNLWDVYGPAGAEAETKVISIMSRLAGYEPEQSWGYTTWGGQGAVFTGLRIAITKQVEDALYEGVPNNLYCFSSEQAHYSLIKSAEATGLGRNKVIKVRTKQDHSLDENDLYLKMKTVIERGGIPVYVVGTTGTTDNFGIDNLKAIKETVEQVRIEHQLPPIHIHADSALGGFYCLFNSYDFESNPLDFEPAVLQGLKQITERMQYLHLADSLCFDFQKLGQTPYVTSLFLVKQKQDLDKIDLDAKESPYVGDRAYGSYHTSYTLECSRMASSISILTALNMFGVEGYQQLLANYVRVNLAFRTKLQKQLPSIAVTNPNNPGPLTAFRLYTGKPKWEEEQQGQSTLREIQEVNKLNESLFEALGKRKDEIFLGDTKKFDMVAAKDHPVEVPIYVSKLFCISPYTEVAHLDNVVAFIESTIQEVIKESELYL